MAGLKHKMGREAFSKGFDLAYSKVGKDRQEAIVDLFNMAEKYLKLANMPLPYDKMETVLRDPDGVLIQYINRIVDETDKNVLKTAFLNLGYEAMFSGTKTIHEFREKYGCNIPWLILMDPTSACNLQCRGCWAARYGYKLNLTLEEMDSIIRQGKELGVYFYMYTGGEPLVRKDDLIKLCEMHPDCEFVSFTNGTLVDEAFCKELQRVGNLALAISLEGFEDSNDDRRGQGVYERVMHAMDLLKEYGILFGTSICYTTNNCETVTSPEFIKLEIDKGVKFSMYFHYMPVGQGASPELMVTHEQRDYMIKRIRQIRNLHEGDGLFVFDFQNDGEFVGGCIAGGRNYFHINANGDAEPCVFIHYSDGNIREQSILEILQKPLFMAYHDNQPFNNNHLKPCPMLENPEILPQIIEETGAKSTDFQSPESADQLCQKTKLYAERWAPDAERFFDEEKEKTDLKAVEDALKNQG